ncbi:hypothetical protein Tco_0228256 [Tanacetum coccineum]
MFVLVLLFAVASGVGRWGLAVCVCFFLGMASGVDCVVVDCCLGAGALKCSFLTSGVCVVPGDVMRRWVVVVFLCDCGGRSACGGVESDVTVARGLVGRALRCCLGVCCLFDGTVSSVYSGSCGDRMSGASRVAMVFFSFAEVVRYVCGEGAGGGLEVLGVVVMRAFALGGGSWFAGLVGGRLCLQSESVFLFGGAGPALGWGGMFAGSSLGGRDLCVSLSVGKKTPRAPPRTHPPHF